MPQSQNKDVDNTEVLDIELDFSAARLWHYLNTNKNVTIKELETNHEAIITLGLRALLPPDSIARLGIKLAIGRLKRQGKIEISRDAQTNEDTICLTHDRIFRNKWKSGLNISPNAL